MHSSRRWIISALAAFAVLLPVTGAQAQNKTVRLAKQFGISYLPLTIMEQSNCSKPTPKARARSEDRMGCVHQRRP